MSEDAESSHEPLLRLDALACARLAPTTLSVAAGQCLAVLGPSGAGKSVLLRQIADLDPGTGEAWLRAQARSAMRAPQWRRQVVYCQAEAGWWHEHVAPHFPDADAARAMLARLGLAPDKLDAMVHECSTGERQRLGLARALLLQPAVLLLDEPTAALDADSTARVEAELRAALARGAAIVLVTHNESQARRLADTGWHMQAGVLSPLWQRRPEAAWA